MSNIISYSRGTDLPELHLSNGLTAVFINCISLSASSLAVKERECDLAVWLAARDQNTIGIGAVGFDIADMPWRADSFSDDKDFLLRAIDGAQQRTGWEKLSYSPREGWVLSSLEVFRRMIRAFDVAHDSKQHAPVRELRLDPKRHRQCPEHAVFLHFGGCVICNDSLA